MKKILLFAFLVVLPLIIKGQGTSQELIEIKNELLGHALEVGKEYDIDLDFSDESIKNLEAILSDLHEVYRETKNDEGLNGLAYMFGFYIIEVIEKNHGEGRIERDHPNFGENSFPFYWNGATLFPLAWCQKRIFDGAEDNVEIKYRVLVKEEKKK